MITLPAACCAFLAWTAAVANPCAAWAQGGFNGPGRYEIANVRSGKVIDLYRATQSNVIQVSSRVQTDQPELRAVRRIISVRVF